MKLSKVHKQIFIIALKNEYTDDNFTFVDLLIKAKQEITYNRDKIEFFIGQLLKWKYLRFMRYYDGVRDVELTVVGCNQNKYNIICQLRRK